jgi:hypothetical protein
MQDYKRVTDDEVFQLLEDLKTNSDEKILEKMNQTILLLLLDTRHFLRKIYKQIPNNNLNNIVTDPLKAKKNDIITGKEN